MKNLCVSLLVDRSGSMAKHWSKTIDACNEYLNSLKSNGVDTLVTVTVFDSNSIEQVRDTIPAADVAPLTEAEFPPRGSTPLLDAVGQTITRLSERTAREDEGCAIVVMTDGMENASREHKIEDIKAKLSDKQTKDNWLVIFLGEGLDAWSQSAGLGVRGSNSMQYAGAHADSALRSVAAATQSYVATSSNNVNAIFSESARAAAVGNAPKDKTADDLKKQAYAQKAKDAKEVKETPVKQW